MSKFSIILPVRNGGQYVKECVNSILSQTVQNFNLLVLDNCSNDGTVDWLNSLNDDRIVIHLSSTPLSIEESWARIKSIQKNEYITLIGHDDILNSNYLEVMEGLIKEHPSASLYQAHFQYIDSKGEVLRNCLPMDERQRVDEFLAFYMCRIIDSTGTGYMMRSEDYDRVGGMDPAFDKLMFADSALWLDLTALGYKATSPEIAFRYRIHESVSKTTGGQEYQQAFEKFLNVIVYHAGKNDALKRVTERYGNQFLMYFCESLSHRILKTASNQRQIKVKDFIEKCKQYATILIPRQIFEPERRFRIRIARILDNSVVGRELFLFLKKF